MNDHDITTVALHIKGGELDPSVVTTAVGISPDEAFVRGEQALSGGRPLTRRTGLWRLLIDAPELTLQQKFNRLACRLAHVEIDFRTLPGVEEAYVDVFVAAEEADHRIEFTPEWLGWLHARGLLMQFTFSP